MSGEKALELGLSVIAKIRGYADAAQVWSLKKQKAFLSHLVNKINQNQSPIKHTYICYRCII